MRGSVCMLAKNFSIAWMFLSEPVPSPMYFSAILRVMGQISKSGNSKGSALPSIPTWPATGDKASMQREQRWSFCNCLHHSRLVVPVSQKTPLSWSHQMGTV